MRRDALLTVSGIDTPGTAFDLKLLLKQSICLTEKSGHGPRICLKIIHNLSAIIVYYELLGLT
jgi:hypothetical protein